MKKLYIEIRYYYRIVTQGIKNLWRWFPIIWNDHDWDHTFIFKILRFKLQNTADRLEQDAFFEIGRAHV